MDGIEKIIARINASAAEECAQIAQKAAEECEVIRADYAQKVQSAYESAVHSGELKINLDAERIIRNAKLDARKDMLFAKQEILDIAFEAAKKKLSELPEEEYVAWMAAMASEATSGSGELILSPRDSALAQKLVNKANEALAAKGKKAELTASSETRDMDAGFILRDGKLEVNCSLQSILEAKRQNIATKVAEMLF